MSYAADRAWTDQYLPAIRRIVGPLLLEPAPLEEDNQRVTDLIILKARDLRIACRIRRHGYAERYPFDFTIRSQRDSGAETEMAKIVNGFDDWLFYGHASKDGINLDRCMVVDLAAWRAHLIRRGWKCLARKQSNGDGTHFLAFDIRQFTGRPTVLIFSHPIINPKPIIDLAKAVA